MSRNERIFNVRYIQTNLDGTEWAEAHAAGEPMADRTTWRIASRNGWWSVFDKKRGRNVKKLGPAVHHDRCVVIGEDGRNRHVFAADGPNELWLTDITEHRTSGGKLYLCAIKDVHSNRIVGYSIDSRMKSRLAVRALRNAVLTRLRRQLRGPQRQGQSVPEPEVPPRIEPPPAARIDGSSRVLRLQRGHGVLRAATEERFEPPVLGHT